MKYLKFTLDLCSGKNAITKYCKEKEIPLQIGAPPFVCLQPCSNVQLTKKRLSVVLWGPRFLLSIKCLIFTVDVVHLLVGYTPSGFYLDVDNIHNILNIPAGLLGIYCFNIYMGILNECLSGNSKRVLGSILLVEFILFDVLRLFFIFLTGLRKVFMT